MNVLISRSGSQNLPDELKLTITVVADKDALSCLIPFVVKESNATILYLEKSTTGLKYSTQCYM